MQRIASFLPTTGRNFFPKTGKRVCVIGAGGSGMLVAERLRHLFDVTVVDPKSYYEFSPGLPRALAQPVQTHKRLTFDYREILEDRLGVEFVQGYVTELVDHVTYKQKTAAVSSSSTAPSGGHCSIAPAADGTSGAGTTRELDFDYCVICAGIQNGIWKQNFSTLGERLDSLRQKSSELVATKDPIYIIGGGLVGTEVAAEIAHYWRKPMRLYDGNPRLLLQLPLEASTYAQQWLEKRQCRLHLGEGFPDFQARKDDANVVSCVGVKPQNHFLTATHLDDRGFVKVNRRLQVMRTKTPSSVAAPRTTSTSTGRADSSASDGPENLQSAAEQDEATASSTSTTAAEQSGSASSSDSGPPPGEDAASTSSSRVAEVSSVSGWYACGDCVALEGVPKTYFAAEEMASLVVANIERQEGFAPDILSMSTGSLDTSSGDRRTSRDFSSDMSSATSSEDGYLPDDLAYPFCISLGPTDGIFASVPSAGSAGAVLLEGRPAALQKQMIEDTKLLALKDDSFYAKALWAAVH
ncbi:unnamed protein product [Amoebophrya sp. A120]|nr:unnamed protein product [Amoebophrya sp. A120]|eukprot:GSA120T00001898001.1